MSVSVDKKRRKGEKEMRRFSNVNTHLLISSFPLLLF
jgi:hypothetical protein